MRIVWRHSIFYLLSRDARIGTVDNGGGIGSGVSGLGGGIGGFITGLGGTGGLARAAARLSTFLAVPFVLLRFSSGTPSLSSSPAEAAASGLLA